jgi:hypothetical protein
MIPLEHFGGVLLLLLLLEPSLSSPKGSSHHSKQYYIEHFSFFLRALVSFVEEIVWDITYLFIYLLVIKHN